MTRVVFRKVAVVGVLLLIAVTSYFAFCWQVFFRTQKIRFTGGEIPEEVRRLAESELQEMGELSPPKFDLDYALWILVHPGDAGADVIWIRRESEGYFAGWGNEQNGFGIVLDEGRWSWIE